MITIDDKNNFMIFPILEHIYNRKYSPPKGMPLAGDFYVGLHLLQ